MIKVSRELLYAVDPGKRVAGVACFYKGRLVACEAPSYHLGDTIDQYVGLAREVAESVKAMRPGRHAGADTCLAIEKMVPRKELASNLRVTSDLLGLAVMTGALIPLVAYGELRWIEPAKWTGGRAKEANHPRIIKRLDDAERAVVETALKRTFESAHKELLDAVGIGLYNLARL